MGCDRANAKPPKSRLEFHLHFQSKSLLWYLGSLAELLLDIVVLKTFDFIPFYPTQSSPRYPPRTLPRISERHHNGEFVIVASNAFSYVELLIRLQLQSHASSGCGHASFPANRAPVSAWRSS